MSRRAEYGETRMTLRDDGLWHAYVSLGNDPITGDRVRPHLAAKTKLELRERIAQVRRDHEMGELENGGSIPTEHWLRYWLGIIAANQRATTYARKEWAVVNWLIPCLGYITLKALTPEKIEMALMRPFDYKGRPGSENTRAEILRVLKTALELAAQRQRIARNPAETVRFKPVEEMEITPMEREEVAAFFKAASLRTDLARWLVGFTLGLRQGEVLGLKWSDFDLETGVVKIRRQWVRRTYLHGCKQESKCPNKAAKCPDRALQDRVQLLKTKASKRTVMMAASVLPVLKKHRAAQAQQRLRASYWDDGDWVFTNNVGQPIEHRRDLSDIKKICRDAGIPERRVHDMRHQLATAFMLGGVSERELMSWFGWTSTRMAGRYQHVVDEAKRNAAEVGAEQILRGIPGLS